MKHYNFNIIESKVWTYFIIIKDNPCHFYYIAHTNTLHQNKIKNKIVKSSKQHIGACYTKHPNYTQSS